MQMKLQKHLSQAGICSRRKAEEHILAGLVRVNGEVAHIGQVVDPDVDTIDIDGQVVKEAESSVYYAFNKPRGVVTTNRSTPDEASILDYVNVPERVFPIGRLDKDTSGLLILTNDGRLSNYLMHPRYLHEKEYVVEVYGKVEDVALETMARGMYIPDLDYRTKRCQVRRLATGRFSIVLTEGKNRQIRRMVELLGYDVKRLKRVRVENVELGELEEGALRPLTAHERETILKCIVPEEKHN